MLSHCNRMGTFMLISDKYTHLNDDGKLKQRYYNKRINAKKENILFGLSFDEYCQLMCDAGITSSKLGTNQYHLSRYNDCGNYVVGNCRFIWCLENYSEKKISDKCRQAASNNIIRANETITSEERSHFLLSSERFTQYTQMRKQNAKVKRDAEELLMHPSYKGCANSQYGSYWITDGISNKKWRDELGDIPDGFHRGRKTK